MDKSFKFLLTEKQLPACCVNILPSLKEPMPGCLFAPRCAHATRRCVADRPALRPWRQGSVRCHYPMDDPARDAERLRDGPVEPVEA